MHRRPPNAAVCYAFCRCSLCRHYLACVTKIDKSNTFIRRVLLYAACDVCHVQPAISR